MGPVPVRSFCPDGGRGAGLGTGDSCRHTHRAVSGSPKCPGCACIHFLKLDISTQRRVARECRFTQFWELFLSGPTRPVRGPFESTLAVSALQWVFSENKDVFLCNHVTVTSRVTLLSGPVLSSPNTVPVPFAILNF